jgi:hypothetical protein
VSEGHSPQTGFKIATTGISQRANLDVDGNVQVVVMSGGGGGGGGACTIADAADVVEGALADAAIVTDAAGTVSGKLRGLVKIFADIWDSTNNFFRVGPKIGTTTGTIAAAPDTVKAVLNGKYASASFQLLATGGPTGTLTVEVSVDSEVTYFAAECWNPQASYTGPIIATNNIDVSVTSSGLWTVPLPPGATHLKFRGNGWGSGSWALIVNASTAPAMDRRQMGQPIISAPSNGGGTGQQMLVNRGGAATYLIDSASGSVVTVNGSALADTFANPANVLEVQTFPSNYNGATWDRQRGDTANGLDVDVTRSALPTGAATLAAQTQPGVDIGDVTINNAAGASAVNIQDGGNAITVDGSVTVTQATGTNLHTVLDSGTLTGITNAVTVTQATAANLKVDLSGTGANATAIKVDGSAVTQPVSGTVSISGTIATTTGLASTTTTTQVRPAWRQNVVLLAVNASRKNGVITNGTDAPLYVNEGAVASDAVYLAVVPPNGRYTLDATNEVDGWWNIPPTSGWAFATERT